MRRWTVKLWWALVTTWLLPGLIYLALSNGTRAQEGAMWTIVVIDFVGFCIACSSRGPFVEYRLRYSEREYGKLQAENEQLKSALIAFKVEAIDALR